MTPAKSELQETGSELKPSPAMQMMIDHLMWLHLLALRERREESA